LINRPYAWFTLTFDHRFIDGASAARFLQDLQELLSGY
jgi:pyruvate/2-oxoglutarate dehydrogenase complex dihydrolipoamide acyltransferase (E2) component